MNYVRKQDKRFRRFAASVAAVSYTHLHVLWRLREHDAPAVRLPSPTAGQSSRPVRRRQQFPSTNPDDAPKVWSRLVPLNAPPNAR